MNSRIYLQSISSLFLAFMLLACTKVGPDYTVPSSENVPAAWNQVVGAESVSSGSGHAQWWERFDDPALNDLIARADAGNLDLRIAFARIKAARATVGVSRSEYFPNLDLEGEVTRSKISEEVVKTIPAPGSRIDDFYSLGAASAWELDLFGRIARSVEAAEADYQASIEDYRDVMVVLYADIASTYVQLRTFQSRLLFAHKNENAQLKTLTLVKGRFDAELTGELDYQQAKRNLAITQSLIPQLKAGIDAALYRLTVLVGEVPGALDEALRVRKPIPPAPSMLLVDLPRDMMRQRPDIRRAERQLASQTAQIGIATADLYPRFSLSGTFAYETISGSLLTSSAQGWSFGPSLVWNVFSGGRVQSTIQIEEAQTEAARAVYERTVLNALAETETAISAYLNEEDRLGDLGRSVAASQKTVELVQATYDAGLTDFQNVMDAERSLFEQQDDAAQSFGTKISALIQIYRSMGGGWQSVAPPSEDENIPIPIPLNEEGTAL